MADRVAERIRRLREAKGLTRAGLAEAMRVLGARTERRDLLRYEDLGYEPKLRTFAVLARALGVSVETLLYGEEEAARIAAERVG